MVTFHDYQASKCLVGSFIILEFFDNYNSGAPKLIFASTSVLGRSRWWFVMQHRVNEWRNRERLSGQTHLCIHFLSATLLANPRVLAPSSMGTFPHPPFPPASGIMGDENKLQMIYGNVRSRAHVRSAPARKCRMHNALIPLHLLRRTGDRGRSAEGPRRPVVVVLRKRFVLLTSAVLRRTTCTFRPRGYPSGFVVRHEVKFWKVLNGLSWGRSVEYWLDGPSIEILLLTECLLELDGAVWLLGAPWSTPIEKKTQKDKAVKKKTPNEKTPKKKALKKKAPKNKTPKKKAPKKKTPKTTLKKNNAYMTL